MARAAGVAPIVVLQSLGVSNIIPDVTHIEGVLSRLSQKEGQQRIGKEKE